jgi:serine/threonine protein kinase
MVCLLSSSASGSGSQKQPINQLYSHCAFSVMVGTPSKIDLGHFPSRVPSLTSVDDNKNNNNAIGRGISAQQKLDMAIDMAESIAELHGSDTGPVVSNDIKLDQWLEVGGNLRPKRIVLNDFDQAVFLAVNTTTIIQRQTGTMDQNRQKQHQENYRYCKYWSNFAGGMHAPELLRGDYVDESVDIWKFGGILFQLLTGEEPYAKDTAMSNNKKKRAVLLKIVHGKPPYRLHEIKQEFQKNKNSWIERRMIDIMDRCYKLEPQDRVDIFEVVHYLRETKELYVKQQKEQHQQLQLQQHLRKR